MNLTPREERLFRKLSSPAKIQDYLDALPINHEKRGETSYSPRLVVREKKAHCLEGALFAAAVLSYHGEPALLMNLRTIPKDDDHALTLYQRNGYWGAISKTNHPVLRFRDPIYKTPRELALSYFHEYYLADGLKTLRAYTHPFSLERFGNTWVTSEKPLWRIAHALRDTRHYVLFPAEQRRYLRKATPIERKVNGTVEWKRSDKRT